MKNVLKPIVIFAGSLGCCENVFATDPRSDVKFTLHQLIKDNHNGVDGLDNPRHLVLSSDNQYLFVASADDNAVAIFHVDQNFHSSFVQVFKNAPNKKGLEGANRIAVSKDNKHLYTQSYYDSALGYFRLNKTGDYAYVDHLSDGIDYERIFKDPKPLPENIDTLSLLGAYDLALEAHSGEVFVAATVSNSLTRFTTDKEGVPAPREIITGPSLDGAVAVALSSSGHLVAVAGMNANTVTVFNRHRNETLKTRQTLTLEDSEVPSFSMPVELAFSDNGTFLYVANAGNNTVHIFKENPQGKYKVFQVLESVQPGLEAMLSPSHLAFTKDEKRLVISAERGNAVFIFARNQAQQWILNNAIAEEDFPDLEFKSPTSVAVSDNDCFLFITFGSADTVGVFKMNPPHCR